MAKEIGMRWVQHESPRAREVIKEFRQACTNQADDWVERSVQILDEARECGVQEHNIEKLCNRYRMPMFLGW